jgi:tyrosinase
LDDVISFGFVADDRVFRELMDTFAEGYCYRYE